MVARIFIPPDEDIPAEISQAILGDTNNGQDEKAPFDGSIEDVCYCFHHNLRRVFPRLNGFQGIIIRPWKEKPNNDTNVKTYISEIRAVGWLETLYPPCNLGISITFYKH